MAIVRWVRVCDFDCLHSPILRSLVIRFSWQVSIIVVVVVTTDNPVDNLDI